MAKKRKSHPWRMCPNGEHWVNSHSRKTSNGTTKVVGHCRANSSGKDQIYIEELNVIASKYFDEIEERPNADNLDFKYRGSRYDNFIAGWTKYWNDVLGPDENLDPKDMVKAQLNIAAGVRWLHRKRETATAKLKRKASWVEAAADYKSYLEQWQKNQDHKQMNKLINYYKRLKNE